jgi:F0F1-type ATP synthase assembly protein I
MKAFRILAPVVIGAILGALMGYFGQCTSGTCPLTSTWWRGALYGSVLGTLFALSSVRA